MRVIDRSRPVRAPMSIISRSISTTPQIPKEKESSLSSPVFNRFFSAIEKDFEMDSLQEENEHLRSMCHSQDKRMQSLLDRVSFLEAGMKKIETQLNIQKLDDDDSIARMANILDELSSLKKCYFTSLGLAMKLSMDSIVNYHSNNALQDIIPQSKSSQSLSKLWRSSKSSSANAKKTQPNGLKKSPSTNLSVSELYENLPKNISWRQWSIWLHREMAE